MWDSFPKNMARWFHRKQKSNSTYLCVWKPETFTELWVNAHYITAGINIMPRAGPIPNTTVHQTHHKTITSYSSSRIHTCQMTSDGLCLFRTSVFPSNCPDRLSHWRGTAIIKSYSMPKSAHPVKCPEEMEVSTGYNPCRGLWVFAAVWSASL